MANTSTPPGITYMNASGEFLVTLPAAAVIHSGEDPTYFLPQEIADSITLQLGLKLEVRPARVAPESREFPPEAWVEKFPTAQPWPIFYSRRGSDVDAELYPLWHSEYW